MKLSFVAPLSHMTSYGICGLNISYELNNRIPENSLSINPIGDCSYDPASPDQNLDDLHNKELPWEVATSVVLFHQGMINKYHHPLARKRVGWPIFELDNFDENELKDLESQDELVVCTDWAKSVILKYLPNKTIHVVPLGYDPKIFKFKESGVKFNKTTRFLSVGKWEKRKYHWELPYVFRQAFSPLDDVKLVMCANNMFLPQEENQRIQNEYKKILGNQVEFIGRVDSQKEMADIYENSDCVLSVSHSEGWGLPAFESMVLGKIAIVTNYAGHTGYANNMNSLLINIDSLGPAVDGLWFNGKGNWATIGAPQRNQLIGYMQNIHKANQIIGIKNDKRIHDSVANLTWANTVDKLLGVL